METETGTTESEEMADASVADTVTDETSGQEHPETPEIDGASSADEQTGEFRLDGEPAGENAAADEQIVQGELDIEQPLPPDIEVALNGTTLPLSTLLESLLFVADTPVEPAQVAKTLDISRKAAEVGLARLDRVYREEGRGLRLLVRDETYQLVTLPDAAPAIETFLSLDLTTKLSGPALEVLAVIAYRQPATRAQVEAVRGVDCAGVLRSLLQRGLIEDAGRLETVGRPILYGVTDLFMQHFGLTNMGELPPLGSEEADTLWAATELIEDEMAENSPVEDGPDGSVADEGVSPEEEMAEEITDADPSEGEAEETWTDGN